MGPIDVATTKTMKNDNWVTGGVVPSRIVHVGAWLVLVFACTAAAGVEIPPSSIAAGANGHATHGRLTRLTRHLETASAQERLDFAHFAVVEMSIEHQQALAAARGDWPASERKRSKQRRWIAATRRYLDSLAADLDRIGIADDVPVLSSPAGAPALIVDGKPILVSALDIKSPERLEDAIVTAFCRYHICDFLDVVETPRSAGEPIAFPAVRQGSKLRWSFGDGAYAVLQTEDGLNFMFASVSDRVRKEQVCTALSDELRRLGERLVEVRLAGHAIDWNALRLRDEAAHQLVYVDSKDTYFRFELPTLSRAESVLRIASPWLQAKSRGESATQFFPSADLLLKHALEDLTAERRSPEARAPAT